MTKKKFEFTECINHCGFDNLPPGLERYFDLYEDNVQTVIIDEEFLNETWIRFNVPEEKRIRMKEAIEAIEEDRVLSYFTTFLIWDLCRASERNKDNYYRVLIPKCGIRFVEYYPFLVLLACVKPSMQKLQTRGVPIKYYEKIPYTPMEKQIEKWLCRDDISVSDFSWDLNFYTCSIFLMDRFYFIPCKFDNDLTVYRNNSNHRVLALQHGNIEFRRDGQINGTNEIYDESGKHRSVWEENEYIIRANPINPMGYVEKTPVILQKKDWEVALEKGDLLLAFHIPAGPGYTIQRVRNSMELALEFFGTYFSELKVKGFWSESWLYDSRLSLILDYENSNILKVQRQLYLYPTKSDDKMLLERVFEKKLIDLSKVIGRTSLQEKVASYMKSGARFNTLNMFLLKEEVVNIGDNPYITEEDIDQFKQVVNCHLF